jgi:hypothetical protein
MATTRLQPLPIAIACNLLCVVPFPAIAVAIVITTTNKGSISTRRIGCSYPV